MTIKERLFAKSKREGDCIVWTGANTGGKFRYGRIRLSVDKNESTHVLSYAEFIGPIPKGLCVLHKCDNPICFNPKHLFLGSKKENAIDMAKKGRHGMAKLTPDQVEEIRDLFKSGVSRNDIALAFGLSYSHTVSILNNSRCSMISTT